MSQSWWAVMFHDDGRVYTASTETANYMLCHETVYQDGRVYREAHVEAETEQEAIAKAVQVLVDQYSMESWDYDLLHPSRS